VRPPGSATDIGVTLSLSEIEIQPTSYFLLQAVDVGISTTAAGRVTWSFAPVQGAL